MSRQKTALITGCSDGGLGSALAHAFLSHGFHVFATARTVDKMASLANNPSVTLLTLDVTSDKDVALAASAFVRACPDNKLDYLVNNAARNQFMPMLDETVESVRTLYDVNVFGPLRVIQAFTPMVKEAKGAIVYISSVSGHINIPWMGTYAATKRSTEIMAETLRLELQPFGVRVLSLVIAGIQTNGLTYFDDLKLPEDSLYKSIEKFIYDRAHGSGTSDMASAHDYVAKMIPLILDERRSGVTWGAGKICTFVKFAITWLPQRLRDLLWRSGTGLDNMTRGA